MIALEHGYKPEVDNITKSEWSELLLQFKDATIYQTWSYGAIRWGEDHLSHLLLKNNGEVIALAQLVIKKLPFLGAGFAYIPWGPIWRIKGKRENFENLRNIMKELRKEYVVRRGLLLRINPNIIEDESSEVHSILESEGFQRKSSQHCYRTLVVDLTPPLDELRKRLDQKWRNQLNRAEKKGLKVIEGNNDELYQIFLVLQKEMMARKEYIPGVDYNEFREIQKDLTDSLRMRIMLCEYEGETISASICSAIGDTGIYLLGATGNKGLNLKGSYLLQWRMIQWMKERGCQWYDLGGINPEKNPGVYHFKAGLSGRDVHNIGEFELCEKIISSLFVKSGNLLRTASKEIYIYHQRIINFFNRR